MAVIAAASQSRLLPVQKVLNNQPWWHIIHFITLGPGRPGEPCKANTKLRQVLNSKNSLVGHTVRLLYLSNLQHHDT